MAHPVWTSEQIMLLIDAYRSHECLWKMHSEEYSDRSKRNHAWEAVSSVVGCDVRSAEKKIKTLRTQFMNYHKMAQKKTSHVNAEEFKPPKWFAYSALEFLLEARPSKSSADTPDAKKIRLERDNLSESGITQDNSDDISVKWESQEPHDMDYTASTDQTVSEDHPQQSDMFRRHRNHHPNMQLDGFSDQGRDPPNTFVKTTSPNFSNSVRAEQRDDFTIFGEHVACRLRNIPDPRTRLLVQHKIHTALFEGEMGKLDLQSGAGSSGSGGDGGS